VSGQMNPRKHTWAFATVLIAERGMLASNCGGDGGAFTNLKVQSRARISRAVVAA